MQAGRTLVAELPEVVEHDVLLHPERVDRLLSGYGELAFGHAVGVKYHVWIERIILALAYIFGRVFYRYGGVGVGKRERRAYNRKLLHRACRLASVVNLDVYAAVLIISSRKHYAGCLVLGVCRLAYHDLHGVGRGSCTGCFAEADIAYTLLVGKVFRRDNLHAFAAFAAHLRQLQPVGA